MIWTGFELAWYLDTVYYNFISLSLSFVLVNYSQTVFNRFRISFASHRTRIARTRTTFIGIVFVISHYGIWVPH